MFIPVTPVPPPLLAPPPPPVEQVASHSKSSSPLLTLGLNPLAHLFTLTRSYPSSVHSLHSIIARASCMISKITIARSVEENAFLFLFFSSFFFFRLSLACRRKIARKDVFVPWGISQVIISTKYLIQRKFKYLLQSVTICYYKVRQLNLLQSATTCYYKV